MVDFSDTDQCITVVYLNINGEQQEENANVFVSQLLSFCSPLINT